MALRRISQLDPVLHPSQEGSPQDESSLDNVQIKPPNPELLSLEEQIIWFVRNNPTLSGYLMEVSEWNGEKVNAPSYYLSKQFDLSSLITIISASITGSLDEMGTFTDHECYENPEGSPQQKQLLVSLSSAVIYRNYDHNGVNTFHNDTLFHRNVVITGSFPGYAPDGQLSDVMITGQQAWDGSKQGLSVLVPSLFTYPINACAMSAWWADLAEVYDANDNYAPGTLVQFGGEREITVASTEVNAVVTSNPGFVLNTGTHEGYKYPVAIAVAGRTPVLVSGKVKKFDKIVLDPNNSGIGMVATQGTGTTIAIALESNDDPSVKPVMCTTKFSF